MTIFSVSLIDLEITLVFGVSIEDLLDWLLVVTLILDLSSLNSPICLSDKPRDVNVRDESEELSVIFTL